MKEDIKESDERDNSRKKNGNVLIREEGMKVPGISFLKKWQ